MIGWDDLSQQIFKEKGIDQLKQWRLMQAPETPEAAASEPKTLLNQNRRSRVFKNIVVKTPFKAKGFVSMLRRYKNRQERKMLQKKSKSIELDPTPAKPKTIEEELGLRFPQPRESAFQAGDKLTNRCLHNMVLHFASSKLNRRRLRRRSCEGEVVSGGAVKKLTKFHELEDKELIVHEIFKRRVQTKQDDDTIPWYMDTKILRFQANLSELRNHIEANCLESNRILVMKQKYVDPNAAPPSDSPPAKTPGDGPRVSFSIRDQLSRRGKSTVPSKPSTIQTQCFE